MSTASRQGGHGGMLGRVLVPANPPSFLLLIVHFQFFCIFAMEWFPHSNNLASATEYHHAVFSRHPRTCSLKSAKAYAKGAAATHMNVKTAPTKQETQRKKSQANSQGNLNQQNSKPSKKHQSTATIQPNPRDKTHKALICK